ncbi:MAG: phosphoribosylamine--glycine ligase, partial [Lentisphaeria bacterium]|nr:phosphoribosylamine--glycine ligase [Lentisphaeria bacterium]
VLGVSARGKTIDEAIKIAYAGVKEISFEGCFSRSDIGAKAAKWLKK